MDVWQLAQVILRRWYAFVPVWLLTVAATVSAGGAVSPEYTASSSVILMGPTQVKDQQLESLSSTNPYAESPDLAAAALEIALENAAVRRSLEAAGLSKDYEVTPQEWSPILHIEARSDRSARAVATVDKLLEVARQDLANRQSTLGAPEKLRVSAMPVSSTSVPDPEFPGRNRVRLLVFGLGLALSALAALCADAVATKLGRRRTQRAAWAAMEDDVTDTAADASSTTAGTASRSDTPVGVGTSARE